MPMQRGTTNEEWINCRPGTLHDLAASVRKLQWMRRTIGGGACISICLFLVASAGWSLRFASSIDTDACDSIASLLPQYADGLLARDEIELVEIHLEHCEYCRGKLALLKAAGVTQLQPTLNTHQTDSMLAFTSSPN